MPTSINQLRVNVLNNKCFQAQNINLLKTETLLEIQEENIYSKRGENNYNMAMDYNNDGIVTYDEYMRYCSENAASQYKTNPSYIFIATNSKSINDNIRPIHIGKALDMYFHFGE